KKQREINENRGRFRYEGEQAKNRIEAMPPQEKSQENFKIKNPVERVKKDLAVEKKQRPQFTGNNPTDKKKGYKPTQWEARKKELRPKTEERVENKKSKFKP